MAYVTVTAVLLATSQVLVSLDFSAGKHIQTILQFSNVMLYTFNLFDNIDKTLYSYVSLLLISKFNYLEFYCQL